MTERGHQRTGDRDPGVSTTGIRTAAGVVYPWQCDQMGHMNVRFYVDRFDEATWLLMATVGLTNEHLSTHGTGLAALDQHIRYWRELFPGDVFSVRSRFIEVRSKTIRFVHDLLVGDSAVIAARAEFVGVYMDRARHEAVPLPSGIADRIRAAIATPDLTPPAP